MDTEHIIYEYGYKMNNYWIINSYELKKIQTTIKKIQKEKSEN